MPTKDSRVRGVRVRDQVYQQMMVKAKRKGKTFNGIANEAFTKLLRSHKKKEADNERD